MPHRGPGRPTSEGGLDRYSYVEEYATPSCQGNTLNGVDGLCGAALNTCPKPGDVRLWIWHRTITVTVGPPRTVTEGPWVQETGTYCLGPTDPGVPTIAKVVARVQDLFAAQDLPLPVWSVRTDPAPRTLVHFPTSFSAGSAAPQHLDTVILGTAVHITAVPQKWTWYFGDGTTAVTTTPGRPKSDDITHDYAVPGGRATHVVVEWGGTFRIGTAPEEYAIRTPATVTGPVTVIDVREARAQRVAH